MYLHRVLFTLINICGIDCQKKRRRNTVLSFNLYVLLFDCSRVATAFSMCILVSHVNMMHVKVHGLYAGTVVFSVRKGFLG
jgi:hypothetical protein